MRPSSWDGGGGEVKDEEKEEGVGKGEEAEKEEEECLFLPCCDPAHLIAATGTADLVVLL